MTRHLRISRCIVFSILICGLLYSCGGPWSGYFYVSAESTECGPKAKKVISVKEPDDIPSEYDNPVLHGPYKSPFLARRVMKEQIMTDTCVVYYTKIFRMR